jgi:transcriptional regulator with XRE-family HTH domain
MKHSARKKLQPMTNNYNVRQVLRFLKDSGWTTTAICNATGLKRSTLSRLRREKTKKPHAATLGKLVMLLGHD